MYRAGGVTRVSVKHKQWPLLLSTTSYCTQLNPQQCHKHNKCSCISHTPANLRKKSAYFSNSLGGLNSQTDTSCLTTSRLAIHTKYNTNVTSSFQTKYNTNAGNSGASHHKDNSSPSNQPKHPSIFISKHTKLERGEVTSYLNRKHLMYRVSIPHTETKQYDPP